MTERKRNANIEMLRIVAMAMIVVLHVLECTGYLPMTGEQAMPVSFNSRNIIAIVIESFCVVAVNAYLIISGYFGAENTWKPSKLIGFCCRIWFYTLLIPVILAGMGLPILAQEEGVYGLIKYIFPIGTSHYWFITCYFQLLLLMPLLNKAIRMMTGKQLGVVLACLLIPVCGIKSICPIELVTDRYGYDLLWFVCLYLTGAYLRSLGEWVLVYMKKKAFLLYAGSCLTISVMTILLYRMAGELPAVKYYASVPWHYNFLLCFTGAIGLFFVFINSRIKEGRMAEIIRWVAKYSLGVYLFHKHLDMDGLWYPFLKGIINPLQKDSVIMLFAELAVCLVVIYGIGVGIDYIRSVIYGFAAKHMGRTALGQKISKLDAVFVNR